LAKTQEEADKAIGVPGVSVDLLSKIRGGDIYVDQGIFVGCSGGTCDNISAAADILSGQSTGNGVFSMSVYPESQPTYLGLVKSGAAAELMEAGVLVREAFCGPCFGAGDTPANGELSIRHATRNFPNRDGSKPGEGQITSVALMDARSIAATAANQGKLTAADEIEVKYRKPVFFFDRGIYDKRVYRGLGKPQPETALVFGPNIKDWPPIPGLPENLLVKSISFITDPVTTTDELIPSGETSSYRSNPLRLAEFTLSRKDPQYVGRAKEAQSFEAARRNGETAEEIAGVLKKINALPGGGNLELSRLGIGSTIYARKPGDGSAREQAASCQRVLGASANLALEYATKRYRSNLINWGILPFLVDDEKALTLGDYVFFPDIKQAVQNKAASIKGFVIGSGVREIAVSLGELTGTERQVLIDGCLINYYAAGR
jgi:aconitate hydratase